MKPSIPWPRWRAVAILVFALGPVCGLTLLVAAQRPFGLSLLPSKGLTVAIASPTSGDVSSASVLVSGTTNRLAEVVAFVNGQAIERVSTDRTNHFSIPGVPLRAGTNQVVVQATSVGEFPPVVGEATVKVVNASEAPAPPVLDRVPATVGVPEVRLGGMAEPGAFVELELNGPGQQVGSAGVAADSSTGRFQTVVTLLGPGPTMITATAFRSGTTGPPAPPLTIAYDPALGRSTAAPSMRRLDLTVGPRSMQMDIDVDLALDDPRAQDLVTGRTDLPGFVKAVFGDLLLAPGGDAAYFTDVQPSIIIDSSSVRVRARSNPAFSYASLKDTVVLTPQSSGFPNDVNDRFTVHLSKYRFGSTMPAPLTRSDDTATWNGPVDPRQGIRMRLDYDPFANLGEWIGLFPFGIIGYPQSLAVSAWQSILLVLPIIWVRQLLRRPAGMVGAGARRLDWLAAATVSLGLVQAVHSLVEFLVQSQFDHCRHGADLTCRTEAALLIANAGGAALLAIALLLALGRRHLWTVWPRVLLTGVVGALLVADVIEGVGLILTRGEVAWMGWRLPATLVGVAAISIVVVLVSRAPAPLPPWSARAQIPAALIAGLAAIAVAIPERSSVIGDQVSTSETFTATIGNVFGITGGVLPYVVLPGLVAIMVLRGDVWFTRAAGLLLFAAYVVGSDVTVLLVPLPLILAVLAYDRLLLLPTHEVADRAAVAPEVIARRAELVEGWREAAVARRVIAVSDDLAKQVMDGTVTMQEYFDRRRSVTRFIYEKERVQTGGRQLLSRDVVLGIGPSADSWENARQAIRCGLMLALLVQVVHLLAAAIAGTQLVDLRSPYLGSEVLVQLGLPLLDWLVGAFFFGLFFNWIRGQSGLNKGLRFALVVTACLAPTWASSLGSLAAVAGALFYAAQRVLFYTVLGAWAFDAPTLRRSLNTGFSWRLVIGLGGGRGLTAATTIVLGAVGVAITSALTGQFTNVLNELVHLAQAQLPSVPMR